MGVFSMAARATDAAFSGSVERAGCVAGSAESNCAGKTIVSCLDAFAAGARGAVAFAPSEDESADPDAIAGVVGTVSIGFG